MVTKHLLKESVAKQKLYYDFEFAIYTKEDLKKAIEFLQLNQSLIEDIEAKNNSPIGKQKNLTTD